MAYEKQNFEDGQVLTAEHLNHIEAGIVELESTGGNATAGVSPTAIVTQTDTGAVITITDKNGTTTATVEDGFSPTARIQGTVTNGVHTKELIITTKTGDVSVPIENGQDGVNGRGVYIYDASVGKDRYGNYPDTAVTIPDGCTLSVGDLLLDSDGNVYQITSVFVGGFRRTLLFSIKGATPVKGVDYYTEADKTEMVNAVIAALPTWTGGSY